MKIWGGKNRASTAGAGSSFSQYALGEIVDFLGKKNYSCKIFKI
jgi:hypothetical protein